MTFSSETRSPAARARRQAEIWTTTFRAMYGPLAGEVVGLGPGERPRLDLTARITRRQLVSRPEELRRVLAPLVVGRLHRAYDEEADFRELVITSMRDEGCPGHYDVARELLADYGRRHLGLPNPAFPYREVRIVERLLAPAELLVIEPGRILQREGVATVSKEAKFRAPFESVSRLLDPKTWCEMGPFFEHVEAVPGHHRDRSDGWDGLFEEKFVVAWAGIPMHSFHTFLQVDYTRDDRRARVDYLLVYEVDDQLERDDGYIEVKRIPGYVDWCTYHAEKAMRFRSPQSNLLSPMIMSVFLESGLSAVEDLAIDERIDERNLFGLLG